jgi:integrase/recombinase XerD
MSTETPDLMGALTDRLGRRPSPITMPGNRKGQAPGNKGLRRKPEPLSREEVLAIIRQTSRRGLGGARDRALIITLWRCSLRIAEALDLEPRDLDLEHGFLRVRNGKGNKWRMVAVDSTADKALRAWLDVRARIPNMPTSGGTVFCTITQPQPGTRMGAPAFRSKLKLLAARAGVERDVYPHQLRHTGARDMVVDGMGLLVVKEQLGHEHISTTEHYVGRLLPNQFIKQVHGRPEVEI